MTRQQSLKMLVVGAATAAATATIVVMPWTCHPSSSVSEREEWERAMQSACADLEWGFSKRVDEDDDVYDIVVRSEIHKDLHGVASAYAQSAKNLAREREISAMSSEASRCLRQLVNSAFALERKLDEVIADSGSSVRVQSSL